jgi:hypothetical protein
MFLALHSLVRCLAPFLLLLFLRKNSYHFAHLDFKKQSLFEGILKIYILRRRVKDIMFLIVWYALSQYVSKNKKPELSISTV